MFKFYMLLPALVLAPLPAQATLNWSFTTASQTNYGTQGTFQGSPGSGSVIVKAYSTTDDTTNPDRFETGTLGSWSGGIGVTSLEDGDFGSAPNHAFDNDGNSTDEKPAGDVDAAVFAFNQSMTLTSLSIGWKYTDADISVLAYTGQNGSMTTPDNITGKSIPDLLSSGWQFIGHYMDLNTTANPSISPSTLINPTNISSSYWLVSAYTSCASSCNSYDSNFGNDYFKISGLTGKTAPPPPSGSVPEPSSLILLAGGLLGWRIARKNQLVESDCKISA